MVFHRVLPFRKAHRSADGRVEGDRSISNNSRNGSRSHGSRNSGKQLPRFFRGRAAPSPSSVTTADSSHNTQSPARFAAALDNATTTTHTTESSPLVYPHLDSLPGASTTTASATGTGGSTSNYLEDVVEDTTNDLNNTTISSLSDWTRARPEEEHKEEDVLPNDDNKKDQVKQRTLPQGRSMPAQISAVGYAGDGEVQALVLPSDNDKEKEPVAGGPPPPQAPEAEKSTSFTPLSPPRYPMAPSGLESLEDYLQLQPSHSYDGFSSTVVAGNLTMSSSTLLLSAVVNLCVLKPSDTQLLQEADDNSFRSGQHLPDSQKFLFAPPAAKTVRDSLQRHLYFHLSRSPAEEENHYDEQRQPLAMASPIQDDEDTNDKEETFDPAVVMPPQPTTLTPTTVHTVVQDSLKAQNVEGAISVYQAYLTKQKEGDDNPLLSSAHSFYRSPVSSFSTTLEHHQPSTISHLSSVYSVTEEIDAERADTLSKLAILFLYNGQHKEALQQALEATRILKQTSNRPLSTAMATMLVGLIHFAASRAGRALKAWREAMQLCCLAVGYDHPIVAVLLNNIGVLHYDASDSMAALRAFEESLSLQRSLLKSCVASVFVDHALFQMATTMGNLALSLEENDRFDRAICLLEESQALFESIETSTALWTNAATPASELARENLERLCLVRESFLDQGRDKQSLLQQEDESLSFGDGSTTDGDRSATMTPPLFSSSGQSDAPDSETPPPQLATGDNHDYLLLGIVSKELTPRQRVREIVLTWFGRSMDYMDSWEHPPVPRDVSPFVPFTIESLEGKNSTDAHELDKVSADRGSTVGQPTSSQGSHILPSTIGDSEQDMKMEELHLVALEHMDNGEIGEALDLYMKALKTFQSRHGDNHPLVGSALHNIGMVHLFAEEYLQAYGIFKEAARIRNQTLGSEHPDVAASLMKVGLLQYAAMDIAAATRSFFDVRETYLKSVGYGHPHLAKVMNNIGVLRYEEGDFIGATRAFEIAYEYQRRLVEGSPGEESHVAEISMGCTLANIGFLYHRQDELVSAVRLFEEARSTLMRHLFADDPKVMMVQENIEYLVGRGIDMQAPWEEGCQLPPEARSCLMQLPWARR